MRQGLLVFAALLLAASAAAQQDEEHGDAKKKGADAPQGSLDSGEDPVESERVERGPFSPTGGTGKVKAGKEDAADEKKADKRRAARKKLQVFGEVIIGWGAAPIAGLGNNQT